MRMFMSKKNTSGDTDSSPKDMCWHNPSSSNKWIRRAWDFFRHRNDLLDQETDTAKCARCREHLQVPEAVWRGRFWSKIVAMLSVDTAIVGVALYFSEVERDPSYAYYGAGIGADVLALMVPAVIAAIIIGCWLAPKVITSLVMALAKWPAVDLKGVKMIDYRAQRREETKKRKKETRRLFYFAFAVFHALLARVL